MRFVIPLLFLLSSCGGSSRGPETPPPSSSSDTLPSSLFGDVDGTVLSVRQAKAVSPGKSVKFRGKIMGSRQPFVEKRASFLVGDPDTLTSCDLKPGDGCPTPWDVCCDDRDVITASTLNVQVIDENGRILKVDLKEQSSLKELSKVIVEGTIDESSSKQSTVVNAKRIQVLN